MSSRVAVTGVIVILLCAVGASVVADVLEKRNNDKVAAELGAPQGAYVVSDNGFRPGRDGFAFDNDVLSSSPLLVDASVMVTLFGADNVCADSSGGNCVLYPAAEIFQGQLNDAIRGGQCEGLVVLASRLHSGRQNISSIDPGARAVRELTSETVLRQVAYWWVTQFNPDVVEEMSAWRGRNPSEIVAQVIDSIGHDRGVVLGLHGSSGSHSVLPIAVTRSGDSYLIHVYDPDFPSEIKSLEVDAERETWAYAASIGLAGTGPNGLDLVEMDTRERPFSRDFSGLAEQDVYNTITVTPSAAGGGAVAVDVIVGDRIVPSTDYAELRKNGIESMSVRTGNGANGLVLTVPSVRQVELSPSMDSGSVNLSIQTPGNPLVAVSGASQDVSVTFGQASSELKVESQLRQVSVTMVNGSSAVAIGLSPGQNMSVSTESNGTTNAAVRDDSGRELFAIPVSQEKGPNVQTTRVSYDDATGAIVTETVASIAVSITELVVTAQEPPKSTTSVASVTTVEVTTTTAPRTVTTTPRPAANRPPSTVPPTTTTLPSLTPAIFGQLSGHQTGFRFVITNATAGISYRFETLPGVSAVWESSVSQTVNVTGLALGQTTSVTVVASAPGFVSSSSVITGRALYAGVRPQLATPSTPDDRVDVRVTNHALLALRDFIVTPVVTAEVPSGETAVYVNGTIEIRGLAPGEKFTLSVATSKSDHVSETTLMSGRARVGITLGSLSRTYDGSATSPTYTTTPAGEAVVVSFLDAAGNAISPPSAAGSYQVRATVVDPVYGTIGSTTGEFTISRAQLGVTVTVLDKEWDDTTSATVTVSMSGVVDDDDVVAPVYGASFLDSAPGRNKDVVVTELSTLSGRDASNYRVATLPGAFLANIEPLRSEELVLGVMKPIRGGFTFMIQGLSGAGSVRFETDSDATVELSNRETGLATVSGLADGQSARVLVSVSRRGHAGVTGEIVGRAVIPVMIDLHDESRSFAFGPQRATIATNHDVAMTVTYNGSLSPPSRPGEYEVVARVTSFGYEGDARATMTIRSPRIEGVPSTLDANGEVQIVVSNVTNSEELRVKVNPADPCTITRVQWDGQKWIGRLRAKDRNGMCRVVAGAHDDSDYVDISTHVDVAVVGSSK